MATCINHKAEVCPSCQDLNDFMRRLVSLHTDAQRLDWSDHHDAVARVNCLALLEMIVADIAADRPAPAGKGG